jgi:hypothetical protein
VPSWGQFAPGLSPAIAAGHAHQVSNRLNSAMNPQHRISERMSSQLNGRTNEVGDRIGKLCNFFD